MIEINKPAEEGPAVDEEDTEKCIEYASQVLEYSFLD